MKKLSRILLFALLFVTISSYAYSQKKSTPFSISVGASLNGNLHSSDFNYLPGYQAFSPEFTGGFGLGSSIFVGMEYDPKATILGLPYNFSLLMSYTNLYAQLTDEYFIGHVIFEDEFVEGYSEHVIDPTISMVMVEPSIIFKPFGDLPIGIKTGFVVGFPISGTFEQREDLLRPGGVTFENGRRVRNEMSGDIPELSSFYFAGALGVRYEAYKWGSFVFYPELQVNYGFTNLTKSLDWKAHSLRAGIVVNYNIPKADTPPPIAPPAPDLPVPPPPPPPPAPKKLELALNIFTNGKRLENGDRIPVVADVEEFKTSYSVLPIVFFEKNSSDISEGNTGSGEREKAYSSVMDQVAEYMSSNAGLTLIINISSTDDENENIADERRVAFERYFSRKSISGNRLKFKDNTIETNSLPYPEMAQEYRKAEFVFSDGSDMLRITDSDRNKTYRGIDFSIGVDITSDDSDFKFKGEIFYKTMDISLFKRFPSTFDLRPDMIRRMFEFDGSDYIDFKAVITNTDKESKESLIRVNFEPEEVIKSSYTNLIEEEGSKKEQYILAYFDFDRSEISVLNREALDKIRTAVAAGKKIEIIPLTDSYGSREHNNALASRRAESALRALGLNRNDVVITYPEGYVFPNNTPYGRILNRTVLVNIISD